MHNLPDNTTVDTYFSRLKTQLRWMPLPEQDQLLVELRQHFDSLVMAYAEIGLLPKDAVEDALQQLGDPVLLGRKMAREWRMSQRQALRLRRMPVRYAFLHLLWLAIFAVWFFDPLLAATGISWRPNDSVLACFSPLLAGALTGFRWPEQALKAIFFAIFNLATALIGMLCIIAAVIETVILIRDNGYRWYSVPPLQVDPHLGRFLVDLGNLFFLCLLRWIAVWLPLGLLSAYLTSAWRRGGFYKPRLSLKG